MRHKAPGAVVAFALLAAALPAPAASATGPTGRLLVMLKPAQAHAAGAVAAQAGARVEGPVVPQIGLVTVGPEPGRPLSEVARELRDQGAVASVQLEYRSQPRLQPNDPALSAIESASGTPAGTPVEWTPKLEGFDTAWNVARGAGALVGVIDTGIDGNHPDLSGKIADAVDQETPPTLANLDTVGHGTHVSSLACAATNNGAGLAGAGFDCRVVMEKTDFTDSSVAASIVDATDHGVQAINMSFGDEGGRSPVQAQVQALKYAYAHGVVLVAAAADDHITDQGQPSSLLQPSGTGSHLGEGIGLDVTAADFAGGNAGSGHGSEISLAAYGAFSTFKGTTGPAGLFGAFPQNPTLLELGFPIGSGPCLCRATFRGDTRYAYLQGTSMASPQVAALGAMLRRLNPAMPVGQVLRAMKRTARRPRGTGWGPELGWGIINAAAAVNAVRRYDRRAPVSRVKAPRRPRTRTFLLTLGGHDPTVAPLIASGLRRFDVYASRNGGRFRRVAGTKGHTLRFRGAAGSVYAFYSRALDKAGNRERAPSSPDATVRVR